MYQQLLSHSSDLKRLQDAGYELEIKDKHLLVHGVPYVNSKKEIKRGSFVSTLNFAGDKTLAPETHVVFFDGDFPCTKEGVPIELIRHQTQEAVHGGITTKHSFSNKPLQGFKDYYEKMTSYANIVSSPAFSIDNSFSAKTFKPIRVSDEESVFNYFDSNSSRAGTLGQGDKLKNQKIGIIGTGGTGSYILDLISKSPVSEIHLFDGDTFKHHNAFRSPGAASFEELAKLPFKAEYFKNIYSNMHRKIHSHCFFIDSSNVSVLKDLTFVFISVDEATVKKVIIEFLTENKINFIDVGMSIEIHNEKIRGSMRITTGVFKKTDHISKRVSFVEPPEDDYHKNIQTAELNALNATFAVIKWKKLCDYYHDYDQEHNTCYDIDGNHVTNDEKNNP